MTKKVLISLEELKKLCYPDSFRPPNDDYLAALMGSRACKWFDAQPDITPTLEDYEATRNFFKAAIPRLDDELAKIEHSLNKGREDEESID